MTDPLDGALGHSLRREADGFMADNAALTESTLVELVRGRRLRRRRRVWSAAVAGLSAAAVVLVVLLLTGAPSQGSYTADPPGTAGPGGGVSPGSVATVTGPGGPTTSTTTRTQGVPATWPTSSASPTVGPVVSQPPVTPSASPPRVARTTPDSVSPSAPTTTTVPPPTTTPSSTVAPPSTSTTTIPTHGPAPQRYRFTSSDSGRTVRVAVGSVIEIKLAGCPGISPPRPRSSNPWVVEPQAGPSPSSTGERSAFYLAAHTGQSSLASPAIPGACAPAARPFTLSIIVGA